MLPSLPRGRLGILSGAGGAGKSWWALEAIFQVAAGRFCDFSLGGGTAQGMCGPVLYLSLEDEQDIIHERLYALHELWRHDEERSAWLDDLADLVHIYPVAGRGIVLLDEDANQTAAWGDLRRLVLERGDGLRLVVVDTLRRAHDGDENSNGVMSKVLRHFEALARESGAAILILHHENKAALGDKDAGTAALRGASALVDNARWVARLQTMTAAEADARGVSGEDRRWWVRIGHEKTNYGPPRPATWLRRRESGVLIAADEPPLQSARPTLRGVAHANF